MRSIQCYNYKDKVQEGNHTKKGNRKEKKRILLAGEGNMEYFCATEVWKTVFSQRTLSWILLARRVISARNCRIMKVTAAEQENLKRYALLLAAKDSDYVKEVYGGCFNVFVSAFAEEGNVMPLTFVLQIVSSYSCHV